MAIKAAMLVDKVIKKNSQNLHDKRVKFPAKKITCINLCPLSSAQCSSIGHFIIVCSVTWPLNGSKAGVDHALIQTSLLSHVNAN